MATKKSFTDRMQQKAVNPTLQFISAQEAAPDPHAVEELRPETRPSTSTSTQARPPQAHRAQPQFEETKSRRLQLLLTPSLYEAIKAKAAEEQRSVNDYINSILQDAIRK